MEEALRLVGVPQLIEVPGLVHGFEQRRGGARAETRDEGRARVAGALVSSGRLRLLRQVHGTHVCQAPWEGTPEGDASVATQPGELLGIETADCLPVLIVDPVRRAVAAAHAGWRGTAAGVATRAVEAIVAQGSKPADLLAALGPSIGVCCYEVGADVEEAFGTAGARFFQVGPRGRAHLDVRAANRAQLVAAGLGEAAIHDLPDCTYHLPDRYFSYRRDGRGAGRMINFVGFRV
jgi:purine-nucleoside/S-methyl-5'-thioadenosine phosphorylase / adenosine deaminase